MRVPSLEMWRTVFQTDGSKRRLVFHMDGLSLLVCCSPCSKWLACICMFVDGSGESTSRWQRVAKPCAAVAAKLAPHQPWWPDFRNLYHSAVYAKVGWVLSLSLVPPSLPSLHLSLFLTLSFPLRLPLPFTFFPLLFYFCPPPPLCVCVCVCVCVCLHACVCLCLHAHACVYV